MIEAARNLSDLRHLSIDKAMAMQIVDLCNVRRGVATRIVVVCYRALATTLSWGAARGLVGSAPLVPGLRCLALNRLRIGMNSRPRLS